MSSHEQQNRSRVLAHEFWGSDEALSQLIRQEKAHRYAVAVLIPVIFEPQSSFSRRVPWSEFGQFSHKDHRSLFAAGAAGKVGTGQLPHKISGRFFL